MSGADFFAKDLAPLALKKLWLFDMDGTLYEEGVLFDGALDLLWRIRAAGGEYVLLTNNSSRDVSAYVERVRGMGIDATARDFYTSLDAAIALLHRDHSGELVYCLGTHTMVRGLRRANIRVTESAGDGASVALIGYDTELDYAKLRTACEVVTSGVPYYGTNCDLACPASFGFVPDCGAIARAIECATGRMPVFVGKPEARMVLPLLDERNVRREDVVMVGDRLYTDIALGTNAGIDSVCVLTGEATLESIADSDVNPTYVVDSVRVLADVLLEA